MANKPSIGLIITLMMFPQIVETIYSPVLPHLSQYFGVPVDVAAQTLSVYFFSFAIGVVVWGRVSDSIGRRASMLCGLITYGVGSVIAIVANNIEVLLLARVISAFGASVGSIVTQTILRDSYDGKALGRVFSIMGIGISLSPVIGLVSGGILSEFSGHFAVFSALLCLAVILCGVSFFYLPETKTDQEDPMPFNSVLQSMMKDKDIWKSAVLVAAFNVMLFSYYSLAPFMFKQLGMSSLQFGYSGFLLAFASFIGSIFNRYLLNQNVSTNKRINIAVGISFLAAISVFILQHSLWFLVPMVFIVISFGIAIPTVLSIALVQYKYTAGTAGAILGLLYYSMIGCGLGVAGAIHNLGYILMSSAFIALITVGLSWFFSSKEIKYNEFNERK